MEELRDMLLEKETVQGDEVVKLVKKFKGEPVAAEPVAAWTLREYFFWVASIDQNAFSALRKY